MNPLFTKVTLNSFIFVIEFFAQVLQGNLGLLVLLAIVSVYYTHSRLVNEIQYRIGN